MKLWGRDGDGEIQHDFFYRVHLAAAAAAV